MGEVVAMVVAQITTAALVGARPPSRLHTTGMVPPLAMEVAALTVARPPGALIVVGMAAFRGVVEVVVEEGGGAHMIRAQATWEEGVEVQLSTEEGNRALGATSHPWHHGGRREATLQGLLPRLEISLPRLQGAMEEQEGPCKISDLARLLEEALAGPLPIATEPLFSGS